MKLKKETAVKRFLNAFNQSIKSEKINLSNGCKSFIYRFKTNYRIEVISKHELNENYFKPYKKWN